MIVTFCGHKDCIVNDEIKNWLLEITEQLILDGAKKFYFGGYERFDVFSAQTINEHTKKHPNIERVLVIPYIDRDYNKNLYDYSIYPDLETVPRKFAILKRNEWMVDNSDVVIAYVTHGWGGTAKTLEYAQKRKKKILLYSKND